MKSMRRWLTVWILVFLLAGCDTQMPAPSVSAPSLPPETTAAAETLPSETTLPPVEETTCPTEPEPQAEQITQGVRTLYNQIDVTRILSDGSHVTKYLVSSSGSLQITSETAFGALYLEWNEIPGDYEVLWDGGSVTCGTNGFLHEYIYLPEEVREVTFRFAQEGTRTLCEALVYTSGIPSQDVQVWLPPCREADILVFPTHADDDVLFFGPLITYNAKERGLTVQTAFMVDHTWQRERGHERLNGLWELGVRHYPILGSAPDTAEHSFDFGMSYYAKSNICQWQIEQIRRFRPLVIVGHDFQGEYGNAGHKVNAHYLAQAVEQAADPAVCPESAEIWGVWDTPKFYVHLYPENEWYLDVNTPLSADPAGRSPFRIAQDAFKCHVSQNTGYLRMHQEDDQRQWDCRPFGLYRTLVGPDTKADVMDNIEASQWRSQE